LTISKRDLIILNKDTKTINAICRETQNARLVTKAICNKGFRGNSSILPRSNFGGGGQFYSPQSLTAATLSRYALG